MTTTTGIIDSVPLSRSSLKAFVHGPLKTTYMCHGSRFHVWIPNMLIRKNAF